MSFPASTFKKNILASTVGLVLISSSANLMATVIVTADVDYSLNNGSTVMLNDTSTTPIDSVNLLDSASGTNSNVFYHTYGTTGGDFGSRVDGSGTFDITGEFKLEDTYTNTTGISQDINLDFTIIAGEVANMFDSLGAGESLFSMYNIDVMVDLNQDGTFENTLFHSSVTVNSDGSGSTVNTTGTTLTGAAPISGTNIVGLSWQQHVESLFVGSILAGDAFDLRYILTTSASGAGLSNISCGGGDGDGQFGVAVVVVTGCNSAISRIGDPLNFNGNNPTPNTFSFTTQPTNSVPEPAGLTFLGLGLTAMLFNRKRKLKISE